MEIGCVIMAAGSSRRFGKNKLLTNWNGKPLITYAMEAVPAELETVVVSQYPEILSLARRQGFLALENTCPEDGISRTIRIGLEALKNCDGVLFLVADQPNLRRETVERLVALWRTHPENIAGLTAAGQWGNPFLFPAALFSELLALEGDTGGRQVIRRYKERILLLDVPPEELEDIDFPFLPN